MDEQTALMEYLAQMGIDTPEKLQEFALTGQTPEMLGMAGQDYSTGQAMMNTPAAEGRNAGGTYVASSPLEHLATALSRTKGMQQMSGARDQQNALIKALAKQKAAQLGAEAGGQMFQPPVQVPQSPQPIDPVPPQWQGVPFPFPGQ